MSQTDDAPAASDQDDSRDLPYASPHSHTVEHAAPLSRYDFATLSVRLLGLYLFLAYLPGLVVLLADAVQHLNARALRGIGAMSIIIHSVVGAALFFQASRIGARLLPPLAATREITVPPGAYVQLHAVAIATCGIILLAFRGVPGLVIDIWAYYNRPGSTSSENISQNVIDIVVGLLLFFGASAIASHWDRSRRQASAEAESSPGEPL